MVADCRRGFALSVPNCALLHSTPLRIRPRLRRVDSYWVLRSRPMLHCVPLRSTQFGTDRARVMLEDSPASRVIVF